MKKQLIYFLLIANICLNGGSICLIKRPQKKSSTQATTRKGSAKSADTKNTALILDDDPSLDGKSEEKEGKHNEEKDAKEEPTPDDEKQGYRQGR